MLIRVPVNSKAHAFFNLGWSIHLLEDNTTPVHTINNSIETFEIHNDVETLADYAVQSASVTAGYVHNLIPALTTFHPDRRNSGFGADVRNPGADLRHRLQVEEGRTYYLQVWSQSSSSGDYTLVVN